MGARSATVEIAGCRGGAGACLLELEGRWAADAVVVSWNIQWGHIKIGYKYYASNGKCKAIVYNMRILMCCRAVCGLNLNK